MKIIAVIGHSKSGKTTLVEKLIKLFKNEGYAVASVKSIHRENFSLDKNGSNTFVHRKAGAEPVCAITENETAFFFEPLEMDEILGIFELLKKEIVIIEGLKELDFPTIVCGKDINDANELSQGKEIICYSGIMANKINNSLNNIPVINTLTSADDIYGLIKKRLNI